VRRLLAEDRFARQAGEIRESFQNAGGVTRAADAIVTFTTQQRLRVVES
jgi:UDP:flavonoid glycosyltransferase YjiC (YdhE family)